MLSPHELTGIVHHLGDAIPEGVRAALATVVRVSGSAYRRPGARMLVRDDGVVVGGVSGGCLEADVVRKARAAILEGQPAVIRYDATDDEDEGFGLWCRGAIDVLVEPIGLARTALHVACLREMLAARDPRVLVLRFHGPPPDLGAIALFSARGQDRGDGQLPIGLAEGARGVLERGRSCSGPDLDGVLLELLAPVPRLLVVGAGPDSEPLAACARAVGYDVTVVDERPGYLGARRFAAGTRISRKQVSKLAIDGHTACVVATHNAAYDARALTQLLPSAARYIGLLGPRRRTVRLLEHLGAAAGDLAGRFHTPTGLDIGAETPEQIALAVLAEIQAAMTGRPGGFLRDRATPIHDDATP
jgi:xanthine/CO dehydrogenase XdhC/CoxF family maturation factor